MTEKTIAYYHTATGLQTNETWIDTVRAGNYNTWPRLSIKAIQKYLPESNKNQKGHMKSQQQELSSKKTKEKQQEVSSPSKQNEMMEKVVDLSKTMYSDQMGNFLTSPAKECDM